MTEALSITDEQKQEVVKAEALAVQYGSIAITSNEEYAQAGEIVKELSKRIKAIESMRLDKTRPLDKLKKDWTEWFSRPISKLKAADEAVRRAMSAYWAKMEEQKLKEEAKARELAAKEAQKLAARAEKFEEKGKAEKAEALRAQAQEVESIIPAVEMKVEKVQGVQMIERWKFDIIDESKLPREFLIPDEKKIGEQVRALKAACNIAGVRVYSVKEPRVQ